MFDMSFPSESFIEDYVEHFIDSHGFCPITQEMVTYSIRQYNLKPYGVTDVINFYLPENEKRIDVTIIELKNETLKESHASQLMRYLTGAKRFAHKLRKANFLKGYSVNIKGVLAGPFDSNGSNFVYLYNHMAIDIYDLRIDLENGFIANEIGKGWHRTDEKLSDHKGILRRISSLVEEAA